MFSADDDPTTTVLRIRIETLIGRIGDDLEAIRGRIDVLTREQHASYLEERRKYQEAGSKMFLPLSM